MEGLSKDRRSFIGALISLPLFLAAIWRFITPRKVSRPVLLRLSADDIPARGALVFRQERIALMRDGKDAVAISLICTHLGCTVSVTPDGMVCPCHGSRFDSLGNLLTGPAERSLDRHTVTLEGNILTVIAGG